ncbi:MAG TPA: DUF72 domain-containing protein [Bacteroidetes bacterium]|nr:hypothetical protein BMS3Bbin04_01282 [bacterium BMS3Bbin04]HDO65847.1 DUF72 domain-containing protein [Bacteroidota bacterium]HEX04972.1 DUF72 domain-containing protein [Bacteroidota bacterium]
MIRIGTSGYHFLEWIGPFYPPDLPKEQWLTFYAKSFSVLEINTTYYGLPKVKTVASWARRTPDDFRFIVKLHKQSTHERDNEAQEVDELLGVLEPLRSSGKLSGLLAQFPVSYHANSKNIHYLNHLAERCGSERTFVEFRHSSWDTDYAVSTLKDMGLGWVAVDLPRIRSLPLPRPAVSNGQGYVRLHGRNIDTWYNPEVGDRYAWDYSRSELEEWVPRLKALDSRAELSYLFFNNCHMGWAVKNALLMKDILQRQFEVI